MHFGPDAPSACLPDEAVAALTHPFSANVRFPQRDGRRQAPAPVCRHSHRLRGGAMKRGPEFGHPKTVKLLRPSHVQPIFRWPSRPFPEREVI